MQYPDQISRDSARPNSGRDSMLAFELRFYLYRTLKVDVPTLSLLSEATTLKQLAEMGVQRLDGRSNDFTERSG